MRDFSIPIKNKNKQSQTLLKPLPTFPFQIRVSLTTDALGVCTRKYRPALQPSTTTNIALSYTVSNSARNALLLYIGSRNSVGHTTYQFV